jgi:TDG/mug DNA glycosylase family protein
MLLKINTSMAQDNALDDHTDDLDNSHDHNKLEEAQSEGSPLSSAATSLDFRANLERFRHAPIVEVTARPALLTNGSPASTNSRKRRLDEVVEDGASAAKSPSPGKKQRQSSRYAPPSKYAHLPKLVDILETGLIGVFVGFNPGVRTATAGHAYAHPSNMFWKLLHSSGITDVRLRPEQDVDLPRLYSMGNTNLVDRPSKDAGELSKQEMAAGTPILEEKIRAFRPEAVCIVGKSIWQAIWRWKYKREIKKDEFRYGWQDAKERMGKEGEWPGAWVFVATATSGLAASLRPHEKEAIWKPFGEWVQQRRQERQEGADTGE